MNRVSTCSAPTDYSVQVEPYAQSLPTQRPRHPARLALERGGRHPARLPLGRLRLPGRHGRTHPVGTKAPDTIGLLDLFGNAAEWVITSDGAAVVRGGSYRDAPAAVGPSARRVQDSSWNERDPQLPKSRWWLSDGPFAGFRVVRDIDK